MWVTRRRLLISIVVSGAFALFFALLMFICQSRTVAESIVYAKGAGRNIPAIIDVYPTDFFIYKYIQIGMYVTTGCIIGGLNVPVMVSIRKQLSKAENNRNGERSTPNSNRKHKGTIMLLVVTIYFFTVGFGNLLVWIIPAIYESPFVGVTNTTSVIASFLALISFSPALVNPILYGFVNKSFQRALGRLCVCKSNRVHEIGINSMGDPTKFDSE